MTDFAPDDRIIIYDGTCGGCSFIIGERAEFFKKYGFQTVPLQNSTIQEFTGLSESTLAKAIHLHEPGGETKVGIDVVHSVAKAVWWLLPLAILLSIPPVKRIAAYIYAAIAKRRSFISKSCGLESRAIITRK